MRRNSWRAKLKGEKASTLNELHQKVSRCIRTVTHRCSCIQIADEDAQGGSIIIAQKGQFATMGERTRQAYDGYLEPYRKTVAHLGKPSFSSAVLQAARRRSVNVLNCCSGGKSRPDQTIESIIASRTSVTTWSRSNSLSRKETIETRVSPVISSAATEQKEECRDVKTDDPALRELVDSTPPEAETPTGISEETRALLNKLKGMEDVSVFVSALVALKHTPSVLAMEFNHVRGFCPRELSDGNLLQNFFFRINLCHQILDLAAWESSPREWVYAEVLIKVN